DPRRPLCCSASQYLRVFLVVAPRGLRGLSASTLTLFRGRRTRNARRDFEGLVGKREWVGSFARRVRLLRKNIGPQQKAALNCKSHHWKASRGLLRRPNGAAFNVRFRRTGDRDERGWPVFERSWLPMLPKRGAGQSAFTNRACCRTVRSSAEAIPRPGHGKRSRGLVLRSVLLGKTLSIAGVPHAARRTANQPFKFPVARR
ncbi:MAG: hypothetical protein QOI66_4710, partial [Myxococcales bacterium]|nr:hypothetical protein [Myxococcales bacterium]